MFEMEKLINVYDDDNNAEERTIENEEDVRDEKDSPVLNKRGMPSRRRKKNPLFFDNELYDTEETGTKNPFNKPFLENINTQLPLGEDIPKMGNKWMFPKEKQLRSPNKREQLLQSPNKREQQLQSPNKKEQQLQSLNKREQQFPNKSEQLLQSPNKRAQQLQSLNKRAQQLQSPNKKEQQLQSPNKRAQQLLNKREQLLQSPNKRAQQMQSTNKREQLLQSPNKREQQMQSSNKRGQQLQACNQKGRTELFVEKLFDTENVSIAAKDVTPEDVVNNKDIVTSIGLKLRNILKLRKARNWVRSEFFYSLVDKPIFCYTPNDFIVCMKETFPALKNYSLSRVEWATIRRMLGKPRRCSQVFYNDERKELNRKRTVLRQLQRGKIDQLRNIKDIPDKVALLPSRGTEVTALDDRQLRLLPGRVNSAVDERDNRCEMIFDKKSSDLTEGRSVLDSDILFDSRMKCVSKSTIMRNLYLAGTKGNDQHAKELIRGCKAKMRFMNRVKASFAEEDAEISEKGSRVKMNPPPFERSSLSFSVGAQAPAPSLAPVSAATSSTLPSSTAQRSNIPIRDLIPIPDLIPIIRIPAELNSDDDSTPKPVEKYQLVGLTAQFQKILTFKSLEIQRMCDMNQSVEQALLHQIEIPAELPIRYAGTIVTLNAINDDLSMLVDQLNKCFNLSTEVTPKEEDEQLEEEEKVAGSASLPSSISRRVYLKDRSFDKAAEMIKKNNGREISTAVDNKSVLDIIRDFVAMLLQVKTLYTEGLHGTRDLSILDQTMLEVKTKLSPANAKVFEDCVEVHMRQIRNMMPRDENLPPSSSSSSGTSRTADP